MAIAAKDFFSIFHVGEHVHLKMYRRQGKGQRQYFSLFLSLLIDDVDIISVR